jgi:hypothetical protein
MITVPEGFLDDHGEYECQLYRAELAGANTMDIRAGLAAAIGAVTGR